MNEYIVRETGYPGAVKQEIVGELVRCKDCKQYKTIFTWNGNEYKSCELNPHGDGDWFCADGERKPYTFDDAWQNLKNESEESREFFEEAERIAEEFRGERKDNGT